MIKNSNNEVEIDIDIGDQLRYFQFMVFLRKHNYKIHDNYIFTSVPQWYYVSFWMPYKDWDDFGDSLADYGFVHQLVMKED